MNQGLVTIDTVGGTALYDNGLPHWNYWDGYHVVPWQPYIPPAVIYPTTIYVNTTTPHRVCTCPNCDGACCDCADCKVKRLEARVAELERSA